MRRAVFSSLLEQEIGYFDQAKTGDLISKISGDIDIIAAGVSDKLGIVCNFYVLVSQKISSNIFGGKKNVILLAVS